MDADVVLNNQTLELHGDTIVALNDGNEFTSKGLTAGFAFHDRTNPANRYVLYAFQNQVRLYKDGIGDLFSIEDNVVKVTGSIVVKHQRKILNQLAEGPRERIFNLETDLLQTIDQLQGKIDALNARVLKLEGKGTGGRPKPIKGGTDDPSPIDPTVPIVLIQK